MKIRRCRLSTTIFICILISVTDLIDAERIYKRTTRSVGGLDGSGIETDVDDPIDNVVHAKRELMATYPLCAIGQNCRRKRHAEFDRQPHHKIDDGGNTPIRTDHRRINYHNLNMKTHIRNDNMDRHNAGISHRSKSLVNNHIRGRQRSGYHQPIRMHLRRENYRNQPSTKLGQLIYKAVQLNRIGQVTLAKLSIQAIKTSILKHPNLKCRNQTIKTLNIIRSLALAHALEQINMLEKICYYSKKIGHYGNKEINREGISEGKKGPWKDKVKKHKIVNSIDNYKLYNRHFDRKENVAFNKNQNKLNSGHVMNKQNQGSPKESFMKPTFRSQNAKQRNSVGNINSKDNEEKMSRPGKTRISSTDGKIKKWNSNKWSKERRDKLFKPIKNNRKMHHELNREKMLSSWKAKNNANLKSQEKNQNKKLVLRLRNNKTVNRKSLKHRKQLSVNNSTPVTTSTAAPTTTTPETIQSVVPKLLNLIKLRKKYERLANDSMIQMQIQVYKLTNTDDKQNIDSILALIDQKKYLIANKKILELLKRQPTISTNGGNQMNIQQSNITTVKPT